MTINFADIALIFISGLAAGYYMGMYVAERKPSFTRHVLQKVDPTLRIRKMKSILELLKRVIHELEEAGEDYEEEIAVLEDLTDGE